MTMFAARSKYGSGRSLPTASGRSVPSRRWPASTITLIVMLWHRGRNRSGLPVATVRTTSPDAVERHAPQLREGVGHGKRQTDDTRALLNRRRKRR